MKTILNPDIYHGRLKKGNYFEGWYYKIADKNMDNVIGIIPGVIKNKDIEKSESFIQFLCNKGHISEYFKYRYDDFSFVNGKFDISILNNKFRGSNIYLDIKNSTNAIKGLLEFENITKWSNNFINPSSMGGYNYLIFLNCFTQVCALEGFVFGSLNINGREVDYSGGRVYIEKNWGKAFPKKWIWVQSNHFDSENTNITCSIGIIEIFGVEKLGYTICFTKEGKFYVFRGINEDNIDIKVKEDVLNIYVKNKVGILTLEVKSNKKDFLHCYGPKDGFMNVDVYESLRGAIKVGFYENKVEEGFLAKGRNAGVEIMGDW